MTRAIPRHIFDPEDAAKEGTQRLVSWDDRIGEDGWNAGRPWWRQSPRVEAACEFSRRGLGLVRWYDFKGRDAGDLGINPSRRISGEEAAQRRDSVAGHVNSGLTLSQEPCWHGLTEGPRGRPVPPDCKFCGGCGYESGVPPYTGEALNDDTVKGVLVTASGHMRLLGHVDPALGVAAMFKYLDELHPVPHPGFRAGQVWATDDPLLGWISASVTATTQRSVQFGGGRKLKLPGEAPKTAILLHDPLQPRMAPWSP